MGCLQSKHSHEMNFEIRNPKNNVSKSDHQSSQTSKVDQTPFQFDANLAKCPFVSGDVTITNLTNNDQTKHQIKNIAGRSLYGVGCQNNQCHAAMMDKFNLPKTDFRRSKERVLAEATEFLSEYYRDCHPDGIGGLPERMHAVKMCIEETGSYFQTTDELTYGVKLSWRNASRCIMRSQWKHIRVVDARGPSPEYARRITNEEIFDKCVEHLRSAVTEDVGGNRVICSLMTVFPQLLPGETFGRRIWNSQLIRFAGYSQPDGSVIGDPGNVDLTDACLQLGWRAPKIRTQFDVLPLIVQASDNSSPYVKDIPEDALLLVPIHHPEYPKLSDLGLKWHAIPALSNLTIDIGGIQYTCAPFNGWYMDTEIACRNFCDVQRYNLLPAMVHAMGMDLAGNRHELVRDRALVEMNVAVLSSFDKERVTIIDHHTASESFIHHFNHEMETRGFIPADWVWITPPIGGSANQVFHQEMVNFFIKPNFITSSHSLKDLSELSVKQGLIHFEDDEKRDSDKPTVSGMIDSECQSAQRTTQGVYIFYGSETGLSESYAKTIKKYVDSLGGTWCKVQKFATLNECNLRQFSIAPVDHRMKSAEPVESKLLVIVTSTFGSGGPPENAADFFAHLHDGTYDESNTDLSETNVFVFGNGNSLYADFNKCACVIESRLRAMKASVVLSGCADERHDPDGSFHEWCATMLSQTQCDVKKLTANGENKAFHFKEHTYTMALHHSKTTDVRSTGKPVTRFTLIGRTDLVMAAEREVIRFDFDLGENIQIEDGDHIALMPKNDCRAVSEILVLLGLEAEANKYVEVTPENTENGDNGHHHVVPAFLRGVHTLGEVLTEYVDLSAPPTYSFIKKASTVTLRGTDERVILQYLALNTKNYRKWISECSPSLADFFRQFPTVARRLPLAALLIKAPRIAPRLFSLSSSSTLDRNISITVRIEYIRSEQNDGRISTRRGLCSDFLWNLKEGDDRVRLYVCPSPDFHIVRDVPMVMICNGTGIAPFRAFWRTLADREGRVGADAALFYFGCRSREDIIYAEELAATFRDDNLAIAYSRDGSSAASSKYVTDLVSLDATRLMQYIDAMKARIYVCGTKNMATGVQQRIKAIVGDVKFERLVETRKYVEEVY